MALLTFREALSKKIFLVFFLISTFVIILFALFTFSGSAVNFHASFTVRGNLNTDNPIVGGIKLFLIYPLYAGGMFLSIFSVVGFIPSLLEKGNIDLLLSKPISRGQIIWGKFLGGTAMVFANVFYAVFMLYLLIGFKFDEWGLSFILVAFTITLAFAAIYSVIILLGILWENSTFSLIVSYLIFFVFSPLLGSLQNMQEANLKNVVLTLLYYIVPQTSDISSITTKLVLGNYNFGIAPLVVSSLYIIILINISIYIFNKKDY
jgi:ABC-type transport system involved in multi-copper enzyme maturation permease subunit